MFGRRSLTLFVFVSFVMALVPLARPAAAVSPNIVISQIYGGGGNTGAQYTNDFIELFNRGTAPVDVSGWSVQYTSATGTGNFGSATNLITPLSGTIQPGHYLLIQEAQGSTTPVGAPLPTPDITDVSPINMSATGGKVAVSMTAASLGCNGGSTPCDATALSVIVDLIGYDGANFFEGAGAAPTLTNTTAAFRGGAGCIDTDNNASDFAAAAPAPRNSAAPAHSCEGDVAPTVASTTPASGATSVAANANISITFSEPVNVIGDWFSIVCATTVGHLAAVSGGPTTFALDPNDDFANSETCTVTVFAALVSDQDTNDPPDNMTANYVFSFTTETPAPPTPIHDVQGASHISPKAGQAVTNVPGIVTALRSNGFYMQDPNPDADPATSEGIFVFTSSAPTVHVGDAVKVGARVQEFRPGGATTGNLTTTELSSGPSVPLTIVVLSTGNALPAPVIIGTGGRIPPDQVIEDDATGNVETSGVFDPASDGIDFYESLEGMRVQLNNAVAVGPTNSFGETPVIGDNGANASVRTNRGGILLRADDGNPERIVLDDSIVTMPAVNVGDHYSAPIVGVLDYNFGNFFLEVTTTGLTGVSGGIAREMTVAAGVTQLAVATFNFENLDPTDPPAKFTQLAELIVNNLKSPDLIAGEEVQDNNGPANDATVAANVTLNQLIAAIQAAGGPTYEFREIDPVDDQDGGEPGGNIRQVFLFRTDRGLAFVDRPGGGSTVATTVVLGASGPELSASPGRIDPTNGAWTTSRKPLAGEFRYRGKHLFVIANHFNSKGGDDPLLGRFQPPTRSSETQRHQQAQVEHDFVATILAADTNANVIVLGDLNDFEFSDTIAILKSGILSDLYDGLPLAERYSYVFEGNSQVLDHILLSNALAGRPFVFDPVHVNAEFAAQASDHDPSVVRITLNDPPVVSAGGPYAVGEGGSVTLAATGGDPEGLALTYAWDLDNNGTFETPGQNVIFSAAALDGPATRTVAVRVTDDGGFSTVASTIVTITNVAPTATFSAPANVFAGSSFVLSLTGATDPSVADTSAGFTYAFDCGSGYGAFSPTATASCPTTDTGARTVGGKIQDKDGGVSEYHATVNVTVTFDSLCALTRSYADNSSVADALCNKLEHAASAPNDNARAGILNAYMNQVDAKTGSEPGKAFTEEEGAILKQLASEL